MREQGTLYFECGAEPCMETFLMHGDLRELEAAALKAGWACTSSHGWLCPRHHEAYQDYLSLPAR